MSMMATWWATLNKMSDKFLPNLKSVDNVVEVKGDTSVAFNIGYKSTGEDKKKDNE